MIRLATLLILTSLLAMGGNKTLSAAQEKPQAIPQPTTPAKKKSLTPDALKAEIEALKAAKPAWREIAWKSCLIEGLKESREKKKPALLWIFIDRPVDDARC